MEEDISVKWTYTDANPAKHNKTKQKMKSSLYGALEKSAISFCAVRSHLRTLTFLSSY